MFFLRHLLSANVICCLEICHHIYRERGNEKLLLKDKGSLKTLVMKWRGYEQFSLLIEISSGPLPGIDND